MPGGSEMTLLMATVRHEAAPAYTYAAAVAVAEVENAKNDNWPAHIKQSVCRRVYYALR